MEFSNPYVLLLIPVIILPWFILELVFEKRRVATLPYPKIPGRVIVSSVKTKLRWLPSFIRLCVLSLIAVGLAGPRVPSDEVPIYKEGIDIVIALDISTSMKALDFEPTDRFNMAKSTIGKFVEGRRSDRMGLVVFAGKAFTQCPLTLDHAVFRNILSSIRMDVIEDGTAIGDALATAVNRLRDSDAKSKVIVLMTDGSNNRGSIDPQKAATMAKEFGIKIYTVQVGRGGKVPYPVKTFGFTRTQMVAIPVNPELLRSVAETTDGAFFVAGDSKGLEQVFERIDDLERTELPGEQFVMYEEIYSSFVLPALLLLMMELLLRLFWLRKFP